MDIKNQIKIMQQQYNMKKSNNKIYKKNKITEKQIYLAKVTMKHNNIKTINLILMKILYK